jgi:hypothetical protein
MKRFILLAFCYGVCTFGLLQAVEDATSQAPNFYARRDYIGLFSGWIAVADTNGDGIPDLIANETGAITVEFGNGNGTFRGGILSNLGSSG